MTVDLTATAKTKVLSNDQVSKKRLVNSVLIAKGIAISLVVIGHYTPEPSPDYWTNLRNVIYTFHMPLFFILSGYLFKFDDVNLDFWNKYWTLAKKKSRRLLYPFISLALTMASLKYLAMTFVSLQYPVTARSFFVLLVRPQESYVPLVWFIYALFLTFLIFPFMLLISKHGITLFLLTFVLSLLPWFPPLNLVFTNLPFFVTGFIIRKIDFDRIEDSSNAIVIPICLLLFLVGYQIRGSALPGGFLFSSMSIVLGITGGLGCISVASFLSRFHATIAGRMLMNMGLFSMGIYLFHTVFESSVRILFYQILNVKTNYFELGALFAIAAGILFPMLLEKHIIRRYQLTKKYFLGIS